MSDNTSPSNETKDSPMETENRCPDITSSPKKEKTSNIYNSLKSHVSQKSKLELFQKLNKDMATDEVLINDFSCVLHKDIYVHGRLYLSQYSLTFYANTLGWETTLSIKWGDIDAITRESTAKVLPNAVQVLEGGQTYFFSGFLVREEAYTSMVRVWQNAKMDHIMSGDDLKVLCNMKMPLVNDEAAPNTALPEEGRYERIYEMLKKDGDKQIDMEKKNTGKLVSTSNSIRNQIKDKRTNLSNAISGKISQVRSLSNKEKNNSNSNNNSSNNNSTNNSNNNSNNISVNNGNSSNGTDILRESSNKRVASSVDSIIGSMRNKIASRNTTADDPTNVFRRRGSDGNIQHVQSNSESTCIQTDMCRSGQNDSKTTIVSNLYSESCNGTSKFDPTLFSNGSCLNNKTNLHAEQRDVRVNHNSSDASLCNESNTTFSSNIEELKEELDLEVECPCHDSHIGEVYLNQILDVSVEDLYRCLFSQDSETMSTMFDKLEYENVAFTPYKREEDGSHSQTLRYTIPLSMKTCNATIKHTMLKTNAPGSCHVVDVTSHTEGVPYGDAFYVRTRYCLTKCQGVETSRLHVTSDVVFSRSIFGFAKNMIISNASKGVREYMDLLISLLQRGSHELKNKPDTSPSSSASTAVLGTIGNFRDISGIIQRIKDYRNKMMAETNSSVYDVDKGKVEESRLPSSTTLIFIFLTSFVFYYINKYLIY